MKKKKLKFALLSVAVLGVGAAVYAGCKHTHSFSEWETSVDPTCTQAGEQRRVCGCGEEEREQIPAKGHALGEWQKTETEHKKVCADCGAEAQKGAHGYNAENVCTVCGYALAYTTSLIFTEALENETVVGYAVSGISERSEHIVIPAYHEGLPVTEIANNAFYSEEADTIVKSVALPEGIEKIGDYAFYNCVELCDIVLPVSLESVGLYAFYHTALCEISLSSAAVSVGQGAFYECASLQKAELGNLQSIGDYAFYKSGLRSITFPASLQSSGKQAFRECASLESVTVFSAPEFGDRTFQGCTALKTLRIENGNTAFPAETFYKTTPNSVDVIVGDNVESIADDMMNGALYVKVDCVKSVALGKNVKEIGNGAFQSCNKITRIILPAGVVTIGKTAFANCNALEEVAIPKSVKMIGAGAFSIPDAIKKVEYAGTAIEWSQIKFGNGTANPLSGGAQLWIGGEAVSEIVIENVEEVPEYAFRGAEITKITLGESVKTVGQAAFERAETAKKIQSLVILSRELHTYPISFNNALSAETEIYYKGTAAEMEENVIYSGVYSDHYFKDCIHYFYSEAPDTEIAPTPDSDWKFGGFWKFASDGKTIEKKKTE